MHDDVFGPQQLRATVVDLIKDDQRQLAWQLIDHYLDKAHTLEHFDVLGYLSLKADKRDTYLQCAEHALALAQTPDQLFRARANLYKAYNTMNRPHEALFYIEQNLLVEPEDFETQCHRAFNLSLMGHKDQAEQLLQRLVEQHPDRAHTLEAAFSGKLLREGHTARGILSFVETFKGKNTLFQKTLGMTRWNGIVYPGKTLYVDTEGGIGDQIINIRFFNRVKALGMTPILVSHNSKYYKHINSLFRRHGFQVLTDTITIDRSQFWTPMMSLPGYLNLNEGQLWTGPYLTPLTHPNLQLTSTAFKIGIKCSGNPFFAQDEYRKIPLDIMLQYLPQSAEIYYIDKEPLQHPRVHDLSNRIQTWEHTLDLINQMDCVVSSCTSLVHAAGAIGKTTFVAVPIAEYYIWTTTSKTTASPWYGPNFQVHKQTQVRDWHEPLKNIQQQVEQLMSNTTQ